MKSIKLNNGYEMPILGFGVYQISKKDCEQCVLDALKVGYRLIDTAQAYNNEEEVGKAIEESGVDRKDIFLTTKLWFSHYEYEDAIKAIEASMKKLRVDYLDLVLLHQPFSNYYAAYRALEELQQKGIIRSIGVSNFYPDRLLDLTHFNKVVPQVNQIETHPFFQREEDNLWMKKLGAAHESWASFAEGQNNIFSNPVLKSIGNKYNKSAAQVILRWLIQRDIIVIPKSTHIERMKENFDVFDFSLSKEDMELIKTLDTHKTLFMNHESPETVDQAVKYWGV